VCAACVLLACTTRARAETRFDELLRRLTPSGPVNDFAGVLSSADRQTLLDIATDLEKTTSAQLAVVTIRSIEGGNIDDFAVKLFARWGIGQKGKDNGVLLLVAMDDRAGRIEVGYGLEGALTDARAGRLLEQTLFPAFREERYGPGLIETARQIAAIARGDKTIAAAATRPSAGLASAVLLTLFLSIFVSIGTFMFGAGLGSRQFGPAVFGLFFGGMAFLFDTLAATGVPINGAPMNSTLPFIVHVIPNLVETVKGYAAHEKGLFEDVARLRSQWAAARTTDEKVTAASQMEAGLGRLIAVAEQYPDLKASQNFRDLQFELAGTENRIAVERQRYNDAVRLYNTAVRQFPGSIVAGYKGMTTSDAYFKTTTPEAKEPVKVKF
jgi:LemA protein